MTPRKTAELEAKALSRSLEKKRHNLVLAESCTGGMVSALLTQIPGISRRLSGSFVCYQEDSKAQWLGVSSELVETHEIVSAEVAERLAKGALERTPRATVAASITGYLGPKAPRGLNGMCYISVATRKNSLTQQIQLDNAGRILRQKMASHFVLFLIRSFIDSKN